MNGSDKLKKFITYLLSDFVIVPSPNAGLNTLFHGSKQNRKAGQKGINRCEKLGLKNKPIL